MNIASKEVILLEIITVGKHSKNSVFCAWISKGTTDGPAILKILLPVTLHKTSSDYKKSLCFQNTNEAQILLHFYLKFRSRFHYFEPHKNNLIEFIVG